MLSRAINDRTIWTRNLGPNERLDMTNAGSINLTPSNTSYIAAIWAHHSNGSVGNHPACAGSGNKFATVRNYPGAFHNS